MEHAGSLGRPFPWRAATLAVGAIAVVELAVLLVVAGVHLPTSLLHRAHATTAPAAKTAKAATHRAATRAPAKAPALPVHPLRPRSSVSVLVLNGNGVSGAAGSLATRLGSSGYRSATAADAPRNNYARSVVLYRPGWVREARRLAHDAGVRAVAPIDGMTPSQLGGAQLVMLLGGS